MLAKEALYGPNCLFTNNGAQDVVKLYSSSHPGTTLDFFLFLHKVQQPNTNPYVTTGFAFDRNAFDSPQNGQYQISLENSTYNVGGVDPNAVRVYGLEMIGLYCHSTADFYARFETADGITANDYRVFNEQSFLVYKFFGNYKWSVSLP